MRTRLWHRLIGFSAAVWIVGLAQPAHAQRLLDNTTISANLTATATTVVVGSATGFSAGRFAFLDHEVVEIVSVSGTTITMRRGQAGTRQMAHDSGERIFVAQDGNDFKNYDPDFGQDCTRGSGQAAVLPWINIGTGTVWTCLNNDNVWNGTNTARITYNSTQTGSP